MPGAVTCPAKVNRENGSWWPECKHLNWPEMKQDGEDKSKQAAAATESNMLMG
jgi:hypothetical protein